MNAAPITLPSPVDGAIHPQPWADYGRKRPAGSTDWRVTKTAAQHATTSVRAIDLGDANVDRDSTYALISGKVVEHRAGDGVTTIQSWDGKLRVVVAHLAIDSIFAAFPVGTAVSAGTCIGHVSNTYPPAKGTIAAHLHLQIGQLVAGKWVWDDPWPLLAINQLAVLNGAGINLRERPGTDAPIFATSRAAGIVRGGKVIAPLGAQMDVQQPPFAIASGLVWVRALLGATPVAIAKNLVHFGL